MTKRGWIVILTPIVAVFLAVVAIYAIGFLLPERHVYSNAITVDASANEVWILISDFEQIPKWRSYVHSVEAVVSADGTIFREVNGEGTIEYRVLTSNQGSQLTTQIVNQPDFGGFWDYSVSESLTGTRLTIVERGEVYHPLYKFFLRFVFGYNQNVDDYLRDVENALGKD